MQQAIMDSHFRSLRDRDADRIKKTARARARLDADVDAFIASGGRIQSVPTGQTGEDPRMRNGRFIANSRRHITVGSKTRGNARAES